MFRRTLLPLERRFATHLRQFRQITPGDRLGVAVSGGADSVALLRLLLAVHSDFGITLHLLHFHHSLRGPDADADAEFVKALAHSHSLEFIFDRQDVAAAAKKNRWNLEDAARRLRYAFFAQAVSWARVTRVAVAHTADDQAETVLAHLIRGTGPRGLAGIHPVVGNVLRPLLEFRRGDLRDYLRSLRQPWREDLSNHDLQRTRARIRSRLLPVMESDFSSRIVNHLSTLGRLSREQESFWDAAVDACFRSSVRRSPEHLSIRAEHLLSPPVFDFLKRAQCDSSASNLSPLRPLTERLIRRLYEEACGRRLAPSAHQVEQVIALAEAPSSGRRVQLPGGVEVERSFADLCFRLARPSAGTAAKPIAKSSSPSDAYEYPVSIPKTGETVVSVPEIGACFRLKVIDCPGPERDTKRDGVAFDADLLRAPLVLRNWRPGDAYRPQGRRQSRKLKQLFLARRVPLRKRSGWPVLESAGRVIWARGFPPAAECSLRPETRAGLVIEDSAADFISGLRIGL